MCSLLAEGVPLLAVSEWLFPCVLGAGLFAGTGPLLPVLLLLISVLAVLALVW